MKTARPLVALAFVCAASFAVRAQVLGDVPVSVPSLELGIMSTFPAPPDDPLLDSSGNVVMDSSGHPVSDPNEQFHQVKPYQYDPAHKYLVQAAWLNGIGCPQSVCPSDAHDEHNEGLLLVKTGLTAEDTAAVAELKKVRGITLNPGLSLGYDLRKSGSNASLMGSHCGAGAPRFDVVTEDGVTHFIGCNSPPPVPEAHEPGWVRLRWNPAEAFPPISPTQRISRIFIVMDEAQDAAPDFFGAAILDNIFVNGQMVGAGPTDAR